MRYFTFIFLLSFSLTHYAAEKTPPYFSHFEQLTYPQSQWSAQDFGEPVSTTHHKLLKQFKPRIWIAKNSYFPIDFYNDYLPHTQLISPKGKPTLAPSRRLLKEKERSPGYYLKFTGDPKDYMFPVEHQRNHVLYGRVYNEKFASRNVYVLKYTAVFAASGLPAFIGKVKTKVASFLGDPDVWHQLDIHGAIHIIIDTQTLKPLIVLLAQHNHFQTLIVGKDLEWPKDEKLHIGFSERSNEPYIIHPTEKTYVQAAGRINSFPFIVTGEDPPFDSGFDVIHSEKESVELNYKVITLPSKDPLYTSFIPLGDKLKLMKLFKSFFRVGPPGIDINTHPDMKKYTDIAQFFYLQPEDEDGLKLYKRHVKGFSSMNVGPLIEHNKPKFDTYFF